jgi:hypothetical protein
MPTSNHGGTATTSFLIPSSSWFLPMTSANDSPPTRCRAQNTCPVTSLWSERRGVLIHTVCDCSRVVGNTSLAKFAFKLVHCSYYGRVGRTVDHFAIEQSHQTFQVLDFVDGDSIEVAVPDRNVGFLAYLERTDLVFQEHLA